MIKFKIIETKQKITEITDPNKETAGAKLKRYSGNTQNLLNTLSQLGTLFGIRTQALNTVAQQISNIQSFFSNWKNSPKSKYGLGKNDLLVANSLKSFKNLDSVKDYIISTIGEKAPAPVPVPPTPPAPPAPVPVPPTPPAPPAPVPVPPGPPAPAPMPKKIPKAGKKLSSKKTKLIKILKKQGVSQPERYAQQILDKEKAKRGKAK